VIIGAPKAATSWLTSNLRACPQIFMPKGELHYFNRNFHLGSNWYFEQFAGARPGQIVGEKSASYLASPEAPARLRALLPKARLIVQLRDPVERAYSDYCMLLRRGEVGRRIEDHLDPARASRERFIADGEYGRHLARWFDHFDRRDFLILLHDDIKANPTPSFDAVSAFLSLSGAKSFNLKQLVKAKELPTLPLMMQRALAPFKPMVAPFRKQRWFATIRNRFARPIEYPPLADELRKKLRDHYRDDVMTLEKVLGRSVGWT
jgi:hypothetical protein